MSSVRTNFLLSLLLILSAGLAHSAEFQETIERDFSLRSIGALQVANIRGAIAVQGWALDKIRVKAKRKVESDTLEHAQALFGAMDFRYREIDGDIELSAEYGKGLDIQKRLLERKNPKASMDMVVYAPSNLKLRVWGLDGEVNVKDWNADLEVRTTHGKIHVEDVRTSGVSLLCPTCEISVRNIRASLRCMGGAGNLSLEDVSGKEIYTESGAGNQSFLNIKGEQLYVSQDGNISGKHLQGRIEFRTRQGSVHLFEVSEFASGSTISGDIQIEMKKWRFLDKALLESTSGGITLLLPSDFSGEVDLWSLKGKVKSGFPVSESLQASTYGPQPLNWLQGRVNNGGEQLKISSQDGDIRLIRGL